MPAKLKVRIIAGRHLPVMDRASELTDAFVEVKFGSLVHKTDVCAKSLNPLWNSDWFQFEVDDELLQDEPLQIRVLDHDTYSAHDAIGKVYVDVDPLLQPESLHSLGGWFPIFDTMHGIRGEILLVVKLELFADVNQFKQSSCGFKFVCGTDVSRYYQIQALHGFVSDLLICDDPEYQWIEKLRTPRASNEARQRVFMKMSGELQRRIGSKVENVGGNAVVGYLQSYDIEGDSGIVVRGIGTAVTVKAVEKSRISGTTLSLEGLYLGSSKQNQQALSGETPAIQPYVACLEKNSCDAYGQLSMFPFYTLTFFPSEILQKISMVVCARSVKLLEKVQNQEEWETREVWWDELRQEILAHCLALTCNAVVGYREHTSICDDVIVLSAEGTAVVLGSNLSSEKRGFGEGDTFKDANHFQRVENDNTSSPDSSAEACLFEVSQVAAEHSPTVTYQMSPLDGVTPVPEFLCTTIDIPSNVHYIGKGTLVQAQFCRKLKKSQSEGFASLASEVLPFIEYELHRKLHIKVKIRTMNAVFGYRSSITIGENLIVGVATGTAVCLAALPRSGYDSLSSTVCCGNKYYKPNQFAKMSQELFLLNDQICSPFPPSTCSLSGFLLQGSADKRSLFISMPGSNELNKSEVIMNESLPPPTCFYSNLDQCPGSEGYLQQSFSSFRRIRYDDGADDVKLNNGLSHHISNALHIVWFRLRTFYPTCFLSSLRFQLSIPDDDELQIWITCSVLLKKKDSLVGISSLPNQCSAPHISDFPTPNPSPYNRSISDTEAEVVPGDAPRASNYFPRLHLSPFLHRFRKATVPAISRSRYNSTSSARARHPSDASATSEIDFFERNTNVVITSISHIPGRKIRRHLGLFNIFIVRETSTVRGSDDTISMAEPAHGTGSTWFVTRALAETQALIRSHVVALGGNALTSYRSSYSVLKESLSKNEAQCLIHVIGDVMDYAC